MTRGLPLYLNLVALFCAVMAVLLARQGPAGSLASVMGLPSWDCMAGRSGLPLD
jgi:hypothetical protein